MIIGLFGSYAVALKVVAAFWSMNDDVGESGGGLGDDMEVRLEVVDAHRDGLNWSLQVVGHIPTNIAQLFLLEGSRFTANAK